MAWFGRKDPLQIIGFQTYGTRDHLYARGRALEDETIDLAQKGTFQLLLNSWRRFETDEIRQAPLRLHLSDNRSFEMQTDSHGYFLLDETVGNLGPLANQEGWLPYEISFDFRKKTRHTILGNNRFPGSLLIPDGNTSFGVITDIDDTILHTGVTSYMKWQVIANTLFKRADRRIPLQGSARLYHMLHRGRSGREANPVFYVSHSPWNLYRYLEFFLHNHGFPKGPILLRSMASVLGRTVEGHIPHKEHEILNILRTYPDKPFVLIGDSGERDADIYLQVARTHPGRILAIYLRSVRHRKKMQRVRTLIQTETTVPVLLVDHSDEVLAHARTLGLVF
jgi:phosphatidate phosphatase APP1